jgi:methionyl-tRNA formyltransferase
MGAGCSSGGAGPSRATVRCGYGALLLIRVQPEAKAEMGAEEAMRGRLLRPGALFGAV